MLRWPASARSGDPVSGAPVTFDDQLEALGFRVQSSTRRGGRRWDLAFNSVLTLEIHDYDDHVVLTWHCELGPLLHRLDWRTSPSDASELELFPAHDVRLPLDIEAVQVEITRVLARLRLDLGDPSL
jgi:hypothetical protein